MVQKTKAAETPELSQEDIQKIKKIIIERVWVDESEIIPEASPVSYTHLTLPTNSLV